MIENRLFLLLKSLYLMKMILWLVLTWSVFFQVPVEFTLKILGLVGDSTLCERTDLQAILELLELCVNSVYFKYKDVFYKQWIGLPMRLSLSPMCNIFMDWYENIFKKLNKTLNYCLGMLMRHSLICSMEGNNLTSWCK